MIRIFNSRSDYSIAGLLVAFFLFLLVFGEVYHTIELVGSPEQDGYVGRAEKIRSGTLPEDPFRPMLYPLAAAAFGIVFDDTFRGARTLSSLSAVVFTLMAFLIGSRCFNRSVGFLVLGAIMVNPYTFRYALLTTTDMMFAALCTATVYSIVRSNKKKMFFATVIISFWFSLAYFTRYTAVALIPVIVLSLVWRKPNVPSIENVKYVMIFVIFAFLFLIPHFIITHLVFGDPFYQEHWRNVAFKMYGDYDWSYLKSATYDGLLPVISSDPVRFVTVGAREMVKFVFVDAVRLGGFGLAGGLFVSGGLGGAYCVLRTGRKSHWLLIFYAISLVTLVCTFFYTSPRFMLPLLPVGYAFCGYFIFSSGAFSGAFGVRDWKMNRGVPVAAMFLLILTASTLREIPVFISLHPTEAREAAIQLQREHGRDIVVAGTCPFLSRYVGYDYRVIELNDTKGNCRDYSSLQSALEERGADYLLISKLTMNGALARLFNDDDAPHFLAPIVRNDRVAVYKIDLDAD